MTEEYREPVKTEVNESDKIRQAEDYLRGHQDYFHFRQTVRVTSVICDSFDVRLLASSHEPALEEGPVKDILNSITLKEKNQ